MVDNSRPAKPAPYSGVPYDITSPRGAAREPERGEVQSHEIITAGHYADGQQRGAVDQSRVHRGERVGYAHPKAHAYRADLRGGGSVPDNGTGRR